MTTDQQNVIEVWMTTIVRDGGIDRYDDLHIDRINTHWTDRIYWVQGGLEAFHMALRFRERHRFSQRVALAYSLQSGERAWGLTFRTLEEFQAQFDWSPPSLYLFNAGSEPWLRSAIEVVEKIDTAALFTSPLKPNIGYYLEFKAADSTEYIRSVLFAD